jgi:hypothetical protein
VYRLFAAVRVARGKISQKTNYNAVALVNFTRNSREKRVNLAQKRQIFAKINKRMVLLI